VALLSAGILFIESLVLVFSTKSVFVLTQTSFGYMDSLSLCFIVLTTFVFFCCFIAAKRGLVTLFSLELLIILTFASTNIFLFYIFFESLLIPMYIMINT